MNWFMTYEEGEQFRRVKGCCHSCREKIEDIEGTAYKANITNELLEFEGNSLHIWRIKKDFIYVVWKYYKNTETRMIFEEDFDGNEVYFESSTGEIRGVSKRFYDPITSHPFYNKE